jgi:hypothetical protein
MESKFLSASVSTEKEGKHFRRGQKTGVADRLDALIVLPLSKILHWNLLWKILYANKNLPQL